MKRIIYYSLLVLSLTAGLYADRLMDPNETETLIRRVTQNSRKYWLPQGLIQARHMEYYEYDNTIRETTETVHYNDTSFRLEIHMEDGLSTVEDSQLNPPQQFQQDMQLNKDRIFVWDNQKYIQYFESADYAVVQMDSPYASKDHRGPATAGIIPWGHGDLTFLIIMSQNPTCRIVEEDGQKLVVLEYLSDTISLETQISFVLDPSRDYAVLSYNIENEQAQLRQTYDEYFQADEQWIPSKILIERFDKRSGTSQLISYEDWQLDTIDTVAPPDEIYSVNFKNGTMVELQAIDGLKTFLYNASDHVDISTLLEDKIALLQTPDPDKVNCATAVVQHISKLFSKDIPQSELANLVSQETKKTALSEMKRTLEDAGLNCMAIETDLESLKQISGCEKILYLPLSGHYVILEHAEENGIWLIDLTDRKFYKKWNVDEFLQEWNSGIALLVADEPISPSLNSNFRYLEPDEMSQIYGGGGFGKYSCTDLLHGSYHILCPPKMGGIICVGAYYKFYERYGCIEDEGGGTCVGDKMISYDYHRCRDEAGSSNCPLSEPMTRFIRACK